VLILLGAFTPWMSLQPDYYVTQLPQIFSSDLAKQKLPDAGLVEPTPPGGTVEGAQPAEPAQSTEPDATATTIAQTQIAARATMIILAVMMAAGALSRGGKTTLSAAMLVATGLIGYYVFVSVADKEFGTGNPMYGALLVAAGALIGFAGGVLARYQRM